MGHAQVPTTMIYLHDVPQHDTAAKLTRLSDPPEPETLPASSASGPRQGRSFGLAFGDR